MWRLIRTLASFVGGTVLTYVLVLVAAFTYWSIVPTPDLNKQIAATVFLIIGPTVALISTRRHRHGDPDASARARRRHRRDRVACCAVSP
jgi:hypothetical protein